MDGPGEIEVSGRPGTLAWLLRVMVPPILIFPKEVDDGSHDGADSHETQ